MFSRDSERKEPSFREYFHILYRNRLLVASIFFLTVAVTTVFSFTTKKVYEARSTIMVEVGGRAGGIESLFGVRSAMQSSVVNEVILNNQVEILRSRTLAERTISKLRNLPVSDRLELFASEDGKASMASLIERLSPAVEISPIQNTNIIVVKARAGKPYEASLIANTIVETYLELNLSWARGEVTEIKSFVEEQLTLVRERLSSAEDKLKRFQESEKVASLSHETEAAVKKLAEFDALKGQAEVDLESTQRRLTFLETQLSDQRKSLVDDIGRVSAPMVTQLRGTLANLEGIRTRYLAQGYPENHEKMKEIERRIEETKGQLVTKTKSALSEEVSLQDPFSYSQELIERILDLEVEVRTLRARVEGFDQLVSQYAVELERLPGKALALARLEREREVNEQILLMLMDRYEEARIKEAGQLGNASVVDRAEEPREPILPRKRRNVLLGSVAGLLLGLLCVFSLERLRDRIADVSDVETATDGIPVLAAIPSATTKRRGFRLLRTRRRVFPFQGSSGEAVPKVLLTELSPRSEISESYRTLRTNILFSQVDKPLRTIVLTSPGPTEGKSTVVANLGFVMAQAKNKTVVIDSDLRRPTVSLLLGTPKGAGLTDVLSGKAVLDDVITSTSVDGLFLVGTGTLPPNPSEMLGSLRMRQVIAELAAKFEFVLFDSPPVLPISDAAALGARVDGVLMVARCGVTGVAGLSRAISVMRGVHARVIGIILNDLDIRQRLGEGYYDYYRSYSHAQGADEPS
ncbi:MAG: hypothetical protein AMJ46_08505 [Latescibacteria bacterium DG_63]|nr:MAG: hypothetical protein AMJ46_08505 [Latescibacteria bacterium DG_63]